MIESWRKFEKKRNFFELVRFDFVVDEDMGVFLMEVNQNIKSTCIFEKIMQYKILTYRICLNETLVMLKSFR